MNELTVWGELASTAGSYGVDIGFGRPAETCYLESYWWPDEAPKPGQPLGPAPANDPESAAVFRALGPGDMAYNAKLLWCYCMRPGGQFRDVFDNSTQLIKGTNGGLIAMLGVVLLVEIWLCFRSLLCHRPAPKPSASAAGGTIALATSAGGSGTPHSASFIARS